MLQNSIIFVLVTCLLNRGLGDVTPSHATLLITGSDPNFHEVQNVNSRLLASLRAFVLPLNNRVDIPSRVRREKNKQDDCGSSKVCKDARQYRAKNAKNRHKSYSRTPVIEQYDPVNVRKRTTTQKPNLVSFQYKKSRQGNRAVATYSQRGFAVACPDCAPGWQVLLSLEPAPPGRVPLTCLNCPAGWESLINITPPVSKPLTNNKNNNMKTNAPNSKNQNFVPVNGQTVISNGKSFVPLGPIIGPGGLLYVPVNSVTGTGTWNPNDWKVSTISGDENEETDEHSDKETEKGNKKTANNKGKSTTKSILVSANGKKTSTTKAGKKQTTLESEDEEPEEDNEENSDHEETNEDEEEVTTVKTKTTSNKSIAKSANKTSKKSESDDTKPSSEATTEKRTAAPATTTVATTTTLPPTTKPVAAAKPVEVTTVAATTKAAAATTKPAATTAAPTAAAPAVPALPGGITLPAGVNLPAGVDAGSLMSAVGGGGLGGMLGGFLGPKPTTVATTRVDPGKVGAELGFDMGEDLR